MSEYTNGLSPERNYDVIRTDKVLDWQPMNMVADKESLIIPVLEISIQDMPTYTGDSPLKLIDPNMPTYTGPIVLTPFP